MRWTGRVALRHRILAVNIFALAVLAGSLFYLDSFRSRLTQARMEQVASEATMVGRLLGAVAPERRPELLARLGMDSRTRLRLYGPDGSKRLDSWDGTAPTYELRDPRAEAWNRDVARALDNVFDAIVGAPRPPPFEEPARDSIGAWPEAEAARARGTTASRLRRAPEGTPFISAAAPVAEADGAVLLVTANAREIRRVVRSERVTLGLVLLVTITVSVLLSLFLARTIARPLRSLAHAAHRVRLGRDREVNVPILPARRDEIGRLARALHDMTQALRDRIDATESFAADVTHELKNPLASLRSAVDSLDRVEDPELRRKLLDVVRSDVRRLDRLIVEIAETSRLDAELSRAHFEPIDLGKMIENLLGVWEQRGAGRGVPPDAREAIFSRFHSDRPDEDFGRHSGLGLAIARSIAMGHDARIEVADRHDGRPGARFAMRFPAADAQ